MKQEKLLIYFSNAIGDAIMTLPTIRAFREKYAYVSLICTKSKVYFFREITFDSVYLTDRNTIEHMPELKEEFDQFVSLATFECPLAEALARNYRFPYSIGYVGPHFQYCYGYDSEGIHMFDLYFRAFSHAGHKEPIEKYAGNCGVFANGSSLSELKQQFRIVAIHTDTKPEKSWNADCFRELISQIVSAYDDVLVIIIGIPADDYSNISDRVFQPGLAEFGISWELLAISDYFIGLDSCFMHIADLNRIPGIALFGQTNTEEWGFRFNRRGVIIQSENKLVTMISTDEVFTAFEQLLEETITV